MLKGRKFVALLLAIVYFLQPSSVGLTAFASDIRDDNAQIIDAVNSAEYMKNELGLSYVNFEELTYSNSIIAYEYTSTGISYNSEFVPIKYQNELIGWVIKTDEGICQFTTALVDEVEEILLQDMRFAILYDVDSCYLYDGVQLHLLSDSSLTVAEREKIYDMQVLESSNIILNDVDDSYDLGYTSANNARVPVYYSCNVSYVTQNPPSKMCWAASVACIVNYLTGSTRTATDVASYLYGSSNYESYNLGLDPGLEEDVLSLYGVSYTYLNEVPSDGVVLNNIMAGYPIFASFIHGSWLTRGRHAVVIYGIHVTGGRFFVMDPECGFCETTYSSSGGHQYVSGYSGVTLTFDQATCKYWTQ